MAPLLLIHIIDPKNEDTIKNILDPQTMDSALHTDIGFLSDTDSHVASDHGQCIAQCALYIDIGSLSDTDSHHMWPTIVSALPSPEIHK